MINKKILKKQKNKKFMRDFIQEENGKIVNVNRRMFKLKLILD